MSVTEIPKIGLAAAKGPEVNEELLARLKAIVAKVEKGEIYDGMFIGHDPEGSIVTSVSVVSTARMFGAMDIVKAGLIRRIIG